MPRVCRGPRGRACGSSPRCGRRPTRRCSRTSRIWSSAARSRSSPTVIRSIRSTARRSSRQLVMPPARKPAMRVIPDRLRERRGATCVRVVAAYQDHLLIGSHEPGELGPKARAQRRDADRARDVRLVELEVGPDIGHESAGRVCRFDLARRERMDLRAFHDQRPAVALHDPLEVGRLRAQRRGGATHELVLVAHAEQLRVLALESDRRGHLHVHPRAAAERAAR